MAPALMPDASTATVIAFVWLCTDGVPFVGFATGKVVIVVLSVLVLILGCNLRNSSGFLRMSRRS